MSKPRVLKRKEPPKVLGEFVCTGDGNGPPKVGGRPCGSLLEIMVENLYRTTRRSMDSSVDHYTTFQCPVCEYETDVEIRDVNPRDLPSKKDFFAKGERDNSAPP
jgi:hypothetical protein